ncbi:hypothetical protein A0H81_01159 [Grifola frondosa]|uniref:Uncharacterized protein n=1 Tax=Grifola frondosa TaxID=5627 RepID=A0A1C7MQY8_GRIFR|nr:hypothetical protein A0H81_01159 [Grifola frondosa]
MSHNTGDCGDITHLGTLTSLLPAPPPIEDLKELTRSQRLFLVYTGIDARALKIELDHEYYLFMDMRHDAKWTSFSMTSRKWAVVTAEYNERLKSIDEAKNRKTTLKNPRALVDKLGEIEAIIIGRISRVIIYVCVKPLTDCIDILTTANSCPRLAKSGTETFWRKHCSVVSLSKSDPSEPGTKSVSHFPGLSFKYTQLTSKQRKAQTCGRCRQIKYPGGIGSKDNHKKQHCSDGVKPKDTTDSLPDWPQPSGVFSNSTHFHPIAFLTILREMYEKTVLNGGRDLVIDLEYVAFAKLLQTRSAMAPDGSLLFRLFESLTLSPSLPELIVIHDSKRHLRMDCLANSSPAQSSIASSSSLVASSSSSSQES